MGPDGQGGPVTYRKAQAIVWLVIVAILAGIVVAIQLGYL